MVNVEHADILLSYFRKHNSQNELLRWAFLHDFSYGCLWKIVCLLLTDRCEQ